MIPDDMLYNPGHLRNCDLPNHALDGKLPDSFSVPAPTLSHRLLRRKVCHHR